MTDKKDMIEVIGSDAIIPVDLQNDFFEGGVLAVKGARKIVSVVNKLMPMFRVVIATKDWHPSDHCSFKAQGGKWPAHCVWNTRGSKFHPNLNDYLIDKIFYKGFWQEKDDYSGFEGDCDFGGDPEKFRTSAPVIMDKEGGLPPALTRELWSDGIKRIFVVGLATDYCVKATVLDALKWKFEVCVVTDAIAAVNANPGDDEKALEEMVASGAKLCESKDTVSLKD